jgi:hypothetical protein
MEDYKWESGTNILLGLWLILTPFFFGYASGAILASDMLAGLAIALLAAFRTYQRNVGEWADWLTALIAVWVILSPWALNFTANEAHTFNNVMVGTIVLAFSLVSRFVRRDEPTFSGAEPSERRERDR